MIFNVIFVILIIEFINIFIVYVKKYIYHLEVFIVSCNRYIYLNETLSSLIMHFRIFDKNIAYTIIFIDQGTRERYKVIELYKIKNGFFVNPSSYMYSFNLLFSYLYLDYIFLLEEDWKLSADYSLTTNRNFFEYCILSLSEAANIYGITLRNMVIKNGSYITIKIKKKKMIMTKLIHPFQNRNFLNGPTIYKKNQLKALNIYISEYRIGLFYLNRNVYLAFIYDKHDKNKGIKFYHIGKNSTKLGICNIYLY